MNFTEVRKSMGWKVRVVAAVMICFTIVNMFFPWFQVTDHYQTEYLDELEESIDRWRMEIEVHFEQEQIVDSSNTVFDYVDKIGQELLNEQIGPKNLFLVGYYSDQLNKYVQESDFDEETKAAFDRFSMKFFLGAFIFTILIMIWVVIRYFMNRHCFSVFVLLLQFFWVFGNMLWLTILYGDAGQVRFSEIYTFTPHFMVAIMLPLIVFVLSFITSVAELITHSHVRFRIFGRKKNKQLNPEMVSEPLPAMTGIPAAEQKPMVQPLTDEMHCPNCGSQVLRGTLYCAACGAKLSD